VFSYALTPLRVNLLGTRSVANKQVSNPRENLNATEIEQTSRKTGPKCETPRRVAAVLCVNPFEGFGSEHSVG